MPLLTKPTVSPFVRTVNGVRRTDYCIYCGTENGKPVRRYRATRAAADQFASDFGTRVKTVGQAATLLTPAQTIDAVNALNALAEAGLSLSLTDAARKYVQTFGAAGAKDVTCEKAVAEFIARYDMDSVYAGCLRRALVAVTRDKTVMSTVRPDDIAAALSGVTNPKTHNLHRGYYLAWLHWCVRKGYYPRALYETVIAIEKRRVPYSRPCVFDAATVERVMRWAEAQPDAENIVPKFALGFFAGIRSAEIERMRWRDIKFNDGEIRVESPKGVEGTPPRIVTVSPNLRAWLLKYQLDNGFFVVGNRQAFARRKQAMCADLGIEWDEETNRNVARHTFASAHVAMWRDIAKTAAELGHSQGVSVLRAHYWSLMEREDAIKFWAIMPK